LSFCAKPKGEVAESNTKEDTPLPSKEGGPSQMVGEGFKTLHSQNPLLALSGTFSLGEKTRIKIQLDSATPGVSPACRMTATG